MISVIIPVLEEAAKLPRLLASLARETAAHEVIVVDGGSRDGTPQLARAAGARVLSTLPGRGQQLAAGAELAAGDLLLFLHADSLFPASGLSCIEERLRNCPDCPGGNFRLIFDGDDDFSRWLTGFYAWIRARGFYYGDSGIFVRREAYRALGGIRPVALMEDYAFVRRLERLGATCCIEEPPLITSSRRFEGRRPLGIVLGWLELHALFHLGVTPRLLVRRYEAQRRRGLRRNVTSAVDDPRQFNG